jgi:hypothetical protein
MDLSPQDMRTPVRPTVLPRFVVTAGGAGSIRPKMTPYYGQYLRNIVLVPGVAPTFVGIIKQKPTRRSTAPLFLPPDKGAPSG